MERRNFIKGSAVAALSVSALPIAAASASVDRSQWQTAFARWKAADDHYNACVARLRRAYGRAVNAPYDEQVALDDLCEAVGDRESELMRVPSPDLAALRWKLNQLWDSTGDLVPWTARAVAQTFADIARLLPPPA